MDEEENGANEESSASPKLDSQKHVIKIVNYIPILLSYLCVYSKSEFGPTQNRPLDLLWKVRKIYSF